MSSSDSTAPAVSYLRVSPKPKNKVTDDFESIPVQQTATERYAALFNFQIVETIKDPDSSAGTRLRERKKGLKLLDYLKSSGVKNLIVQRIDRLFRSTTDGLLQMEEWTDQGIAVHFADQGGNMLNTSTPEGVLCFTTLLGYATFERQMTQRRTKTSMLEYQRKGKKMGGVPPYGKMFDGERIIDDPSESPVVTQIVELTKQDLPPSVIAAMLNGEKVPSRGAEWRGRTIEKILGRI